MKNTQALIDGAILMEFVAICFFFPIIKLNFVIFGFAAGKIFVGLINRD